MGTLTRARLALQERRPRRVVPCWPPPLVALLPLEEKVANLSGKRGKPFWQSTVRPAGIPADAVFWNRKRPRQPLSVKAIQKKMERYAKAAGIEATCHQLRHTFASNLLEHGAEIVTIKDLLGHESVHSSERYARVSNRKVKQEYVRTMKKVIRQTKV